MIDFAAAYPNSRKTCDERTVRLTADGPEVTLRVPVREVALSGGEPSSATRTRSIARVEFGIGAPPREALRSQMQPESAHTAVVAGAHVAPWSSE